MIDGLTIKETAISTDVNETKYLTFVKYHLKDRKTPVITVYSSKDFTYLGQLYFYPQWRKYVFESNGEIIYDSKCLNDINNYLDLMQTAWVESRRDSK